MTTDLVKSFLNQTPHDLPFELQLGNHMRKCRFLKCFDWDIYCVEVILWFGLTIQQTTAYGIVETWFKAVPRFGYKIILIDQRNNAYVRNIFYEYKGAPRALSKDEFDEFVCDRDESPTNWSLKEYLINNKRIIELKSCDSWIRRYPTESKVECYTDFIDARFSMWFQYLTNRYQFCLDEPFKPIFRRHHFETSKQFLDQMEILIDYLQQFWIDRRPFTFENYENVDSHCSFLHGALLAFQTRTHLMPEVVQILDPTRTSLLIRLMDQSRNADYLPTAVLISLRLTDHDRQKVIKQFSTRSGLYGESALIWPLQHYGILHTHAEIVKTAFSQDVINDVFQLDWILDELDSIWQVNVQAPVDEFGEICDWFYLSRYIAGLLCSTIRSEIDVQHKMQHFVDRQANQFLLSSTDGRGRQIILQIDEYVVAVDTVDPMDGRNIGIPVVKITQYMDDDRVLRRTIERLPSNVSVEHIESSSDNFIEMRKFLDLASLKYHFDEFDDHDLQLKVLDAVTKCFGSVGVLLTKRQEVKAFVNGAFHYCDAISSNNHSISKTLAVGEERKDTKLITFNILAEHETPFLPIHSTKYDQKMVNVRYEEPYSVEIVDVGVFFENEIERLNVDS